MHRLNKLAAILATIALFGSTYLLAEDRPAAATADTVRKEMQQDVVLRALVDELTRNIERLKIEDMAQPYFIEYALTDGTGAFVSARLGAVTSRRADSRSRRLRTDVRVGDYELDNTNFQSGGFGDFGFGGMGGGMSGISVPIEDDYTAIRQALWWATDRDYKSVVEALERKKAFMETKLIEDKPEDFSREKPSLHFEPQVRVELDLAALEKLAVELSSIFREFPDVQSSIVSASGGASNRYLVNSEGTRIRTANTSYSITITATVQADDGMKMTDTITERAESLDKLPPHSDLEKQCREMVAQLLKIKDAPKLDAYTGPVLFDARPAAQIFSQTFSSRFAGGQRPVGGQAQPDDFEKKIGTTILPKSFTVIDDPTREEIDGTPVAAHYRYDQQGVPAQSVMLVEKGKLLAQVMSRNPSKVAKSSTGHGRGDWRPSASTGCLVVQTKGGKSDDDLKQKLIELCEQEDLEFGIRIAALGATSGGMDNRFSMLMESLGGDFGFNRFGGAAATPLAIYKIYRDGREELVRGAEIARIDLKAFKRIPATGKTLYVHNTGSGASAKTVAAPAMLFEELDLAKIDRDFDKPPILPTPLARADREN